MAITKAQEGINVDELKKKLKELDRQKEEILLENSYPKDYLKIHYHCDICKDTGFVNIPNQILVGLFKEKTLEHLTQIYILKIFTKIIQLVPTRT